MLRMLIGLVAVTVLGWTGSALALGLGEIEAKTRLNQPLSALIPIPTATPREIESLVVELASNEDFERFGMERTEYLSTLRFEVEGKSIRVFSKQPAREPFVSFLLNVRWDGGRLLREYTLLLDPPSYAEQKPAPSTPAPAVTQAPAAKAPAATPPPATQPAEAPVETAEPVEATAAAPAPAPAEAVPVPASTASASSYGPVQPQETLWSIAYKLRPDPNTITMDQMQVALFNANPQAFNGGRLTGLMKGSVLRVPGLDEIQAVDSLAAKAQVASARSASYQAPAARPAVAAPVTAPPPTPEPEPAAAETKAEPAPEPPSTAIQPSETVATTPISEPASSPPQEIAQAPASEPAAPPPTETPVQEAPAQQAQAEPAPAPAESPPPAPVLPEEPGLVGKVMTVVGDLTDRGRELASHPLAIPAAAGFFALLFGLLGFRKLRDKYAQWSYNRASRKLLQTDKGSAASADKTEVQEPAGKSTLAAMEETSTENAATMVNPAVSAGATQAFAATAVTQGARSQNLEATQQSTLQQTMVQEPAAARSGARQVDFDVTGQYASETVQINLDAGDPVSEAEFHRAYGLYDEAALLLKQALQKDPKRTDARVKLAEIYFEASKAAEFVGVAKELKGQLPDAEWQKIALLGSQIAPSDDLFKGAAAGGAGGAVDLSFDEPATALTPAPAQAPAAAPAADSGMLDFKLEDFQLPGASAAPAAPAAAPAAPVGDALEFDLGGLSLDTAAAAPAESPGETKMEGLDLGNFDLGEPAAAPAEGESIELSTEVPAEAELTASADDSGTKLDLARAYVDMGDNDMAKSLLNEVLEQGNEQQKQEAQKLLQRVPA